MLLALLERGIIDRERAGLALADVPAQRCRLAPGHPVARTIALGIAERPQIECIDALIRRSAMTHRPPPCPVRPPGPRPWRDRSEEHTSELQSLMRISYAVFCLKKKQNTH